MIERQVKNIMEALRQEGSLVREGGNSNGRLVILKD